MGITLSARVGPGKHHLYIDTAEHLGQASRVDHAAQIGV